MAVPGLPTAAILRAIFIFVWSLSPGQVSSMLRALVPELVFDWNLLFSFDSGFAG